LDRRASLHNMIGRVVIETSETLYDIFSQIQNKIFLFKKWG
jgi:hypothetical protein